MDDYYEATRYRSACYPLPGAIKIMSLPLILLENGVLIDIDVAHEGWPRDTIFPVAPCHPGWAAQCAEEDFDNDSLERLAAWADNA